MWIGRRQEKGRADGWEAEQTRDDLEAKALDADLGWA